MPMADRNMTNFICNKYFLKQVLPKKQAQFQAYVEVKIT